MIRTILRWLGICFHAKIPCPHCPVPTACRWGKQCAHKEMPR